MEQDHKDLTSRSSKAWAGIFIIIIGTVLLLDNIVPGIPNWLFSWSTFLIALGLFIGIKHSFRNSGWFIMVLVGSYFTLEDAMGDQFNISKVALPLMLVALGLFILFKPKSECKKRRRWRRGFDQQPAGMAFEESVTAEKRSTTDYLDSVNVFGGSHQAVYSKNFKGGEIVAVFGGCDANLTQADFEGEIVLDITAIFGGAKVIIPSGWQVKSEITAIFGGLDDKRSINAVTQSNNKLLIIKGIALFGGVDIRNY